MNTFDFVQKKALSHEGSLQGRMSQNKRSFLKINLQF